MGNFILTLLHASTNAHLLHLKSKSYSEHMALGTFYEELPGLVDDLAEAIQGTLEEILEYDYDYYKPASTALEELQSVKEFVKEQRYSLPDSSEIQNLVDEIAALIDTTIYKLKFLK